MEVHEEEQKINMASCKEQHELAIEEKKTNKTTIGYRREKTTNERKQLQMLLNEKLIRALDAFAKKLDDQ